MRKQSSATDWDYKRCSNILFALSLAYLFSKLAIRFPSANINYRVALIIAATCNLLTSLIKMMRINRTCGYYRQNIYYNFAMHMQVEVIVKAESRRWTAGYKYAKNNTRKIPLVNRPSRYYFYRNRNWTWEIIRRRIKWIKWIETIIRGIHYESNEMTRGYIGEYIHISLSRYAAAKIIIRQVMRNQIEARSVI